MYPGSSGPISPRRTKKSTMTSVQFVLNSVVSAMSSVTFLIGYLAKMAAEQGVKGARQLCGRAYACGDRAVSQSWATAVKWWLTQGSQC